MSAGRRERLVREFEAAHPKLAPGRVARLLMAELSERDRTRFLMDLLTDDVGAARRGRVRIIEHRALAARQQAEWTQRAEEAEAEARAEKERRRAARAEQLRAAYPTMPPEDWRTRAFRTWLTTDDGQRYKADRRGRWEAEQAAIAERKAEREAARAKRQALREAEEAEQRLYVEHPEEWHERHGLGRLRREIERFERTAWERGRLELTAELLGASFALGDGRQVTWGAATLADHRQRIELLMGNVTGNLDTIRLHEIAAHELREAHARCLNDLAGSMLEVAS